MYYYYYPTLESSTCTGCPNKFGIRQKVLRSTGTRTLNLTVRVLRVGAFTNSAIQHALLLGQYFQNLLGHPVVLRAVVV